MLKLTKDKDVEEYLAYLDKVDNLRRLARYFPTEEQEQVEANEYVKNLLNDIDQHSTLDPY
jgi:hypothetical protein